MPASFGGVGGAAEDDDAVPPGASDDDALEDGDGVDGAVEDEEDDAGGVVVELDADDGGCVVLDVDVSRWQPATPNTSAMPRTSESLRVNIGGPPAWIPNGDSGMPSIRSRIGAIDRVRNESCFGRALSQ